MKMSDVMVSYNFDDYLLTNPSLGHRWRNAMYNFFITVSSSSYDYSYRQQLLDGFYHSNLRFMKCGISEVPTDPIVLCVMRNESERLRIFFKHYRSIGVDNFVVIDNGSTDGTLSLLCQQTGTDVWYTPDKFDARTKSGWINRLIAFYGIKHWYLLVDADELLSWVGMECQTIGDILRFISKINMNRCRAIMIDMYSKSTVNNGVFEEQFMRSKYFDEDTYYHKKREEVYLICGGPRKRVLNIETWLTKYPLFRLQQNEIISNPHTIFPYDNSKTPCYFALLHYKFISKSDFDKISLYVKEGNYVGGSIEYKRYLEKITNNELNFYQNDSLEYIKSDSLAKIKMLDVMRR